MVDGYTLPDDLRSMQEQALAATRAALARVEAELDAAKKEVAQLIRLGSLLQEQIRVSQSLLGETSGPVQQPDHEAQLTELALEATPQGVVVIGSDDTADEPPLPEPKTGVSGGPNASPYRAGLILRAAGDWMSTDDILREFQARGWVNATWKDPEANVKQAARRAWERGWAERDGVTGKYRTTVALTTAE